MDVSSEYAERKGEKAKRMKKCESINTHINMKDDFINESGAAC